MGHGSHCPAGAAAGTLLPARRGQPWEGCPPAPAPCVRMTCALQAPRTRHLCPGQCQGRAAARPGSRWPRRGGRTGRWSQPGLSPERPVLGRCPAGWAGPRALCPAWQPSVQEAGPGARPVPPVAAEAVPGTSRDRAPCEEGSSRAGSGSRPRRPPSEDMCPGPLRPAPGPGRVGRGEGRRAAWGPARPLGTELRPRQAPCPPGGLVCTGSRMDQLARRPGGVALPCSPQTWPGPLGSWCLAGPTPVSTDSLATHLGLHPPSWRGSQVHSGGGSG